MNWFSRCHEISSGGAICGPYVRAQCASLGGVATTFLAMKSARTLQLPDAASDVLKDFCPLKLLTRNLSTITA